MTDTVIHTVQVDSRDRDSTTQSANNYVMYMTEPVKDIKEVIIRDIQVPNSTYNIKYNGASNVIRIGGGAVTPFNVEIEPGSYSGLDLASHIYDITSYKATGAAGDLDADWNVIYRTGSKKFVFTQTSTFSVDFFFDDVADTFGYENTGPHVSSTTVPSWLVNDSTVQNNFIESSKIANLVKDKYCYLEIEELTDPRVQTAKRSDANGFTGSNLSRIFGKVPLYAGPGSDIFFDRNSTFKLVRRYKSPLTSLARLSIRWIDYQGNLLQFNGLDENSFTLELVCEDRTKGW